MGSLGKLLRATTVFYWNSENYINSNANIIFRSYAARKGTREKARKKKVKVEVKKVAFVPYKQRKAQLETFRPSKRINDLWKQVPVDDVWVARYNRLKVYDFEEAVNCHRETHHPTMYNAPDASLTAIVELDMRAEKKNRYIDNLSRIAAIPYPFHQNVERTVIAFVKGQEFQSIATKAGATLVGGPEIIKDIQNGDISLQDYQFVIAHPNILPELVALRGLMKKKFPNPKSGTLGVDLREMISRFLTGIQYTADKNEFEQDYAAACAAIGILSMDIQHLEENLRALIKDINSARPKREGPFITRCFLTSAPSPEKFKINLDKYIENTSNVTDKTAQSSEDQDDGDETPVKVSL